MTKYVPEVFNNGIRVDITFGPFDIEQLAKFIETLLERNPNHIIKVRKVKR